MSWGFIPQIFIASVEGSHRLPLIAKEMERIGINSYTINKQIPPAKKTFENITKSCSDNHLQIYQQGKHHPFICVFEDDIYIDNLKDIVPVLQEVHSFIKTNKSWDFLFLGHFPWKIGKKYSNRIHESISWCTHAYLISQKGMEFMLKFSPEDMMKTGRLAVPVLYDIIFKDAGGIDTFIAYNSYRNKLNSYAVVPMLVKQYSIPKWAIKAKFAEIASKLGGWWSQKILLIAWALLWIIIMCILRMSKK